MITFLSSFFTMLLVAALSERALAGPAAATADFQFRMPHRVSYQLQAEALETHKNSDGQWLRARPLNGGTNTVEFSSRVVLQLEPGLELSGLIEGHALDRSR